MSFVITTVSPATVVQVSDTRLSSLTNKSVLSQCLRKSVIVMGTEARFVLGWSGLATTDKGHHTADWIFKALHEMNAVELSPDEITGNLASLATTHFQTLIARDKRCEFVLGGWHKSEPFVGFVSNYAIGGAEWTESGPRHHIPSFSEAATASPKFQGWIQRFRNPTRNHFVVSVIGDCEPSKLKTLFRGLRSLLKKRAGSSEISGACRQIAAEAARHSKTIGKDLIAVEMEFDGQTHCSHYSENGTEAVLVPDTLSILGSSTQMTIATSLSEDQMTIRLRGKIIKRQASSSSKV